MAKADDQSGIVEPAPALPVIFVGIVAELGIGAVGTRIVTPFAAGIGACRFLLIAC
jgi:hypothetical protein